MIIGGVYGSSWLYVNSIIYLNCSRVNNSPSCEENKAAAMINSTSPLSGTILTILHKGTIYLCPSETLPLQCYKAKADQTPLVWSKLPLSEEENIPIGFTAITSVCDEIWFTSSNGIVVLDTNTEIIKSCGGNLKNIKKACLISKNGTTYAIGAGETGQEIWKNTDPTKKSTWLKLGEFDFVRPMPSCILFDNKIYAMGGYDSPTFYRSVAILDTITGNVTKGIDLPKTSAFHKLAIIEGRVTIIGGIGSSSIYDPILSLDLKSNTWNTTSMNLSMPLYSFGLIQFPGTLDMNELVTTTSTTTKIAPTSTTTTKAPTTTTTTKAPTTKTTYGKCCRYVTK